MALACPGWIYARPRDKDDSDNTVLLHLPAGVPPSFLIPRGTTDFVRSYRCWWFQVSPLKRRHNGDPCTCRRKCAGGTFAPELHGICPCKATGVIESTLMLGGDASHRFLSFFFFPSHKPSLSKARREYSMQRVIVLDPYSINNKLIKLQSFALILQMRDLCRIRQTNIMSVWR